MFIEDLPYVFLSSNPYHLPKHQPAQSINISALEFHYLVKCKKTSLHSNNSALDPAIL